jgi:FMN phosphatase YigB (HAD superfamily)
MIKAVIFDCFGVIRPDNLLLAYERLGGDVAADRRFIEDTIMAANRGMIPNARSVFAGHLGVSIEKWLEAIEAGAENDQRVLDRAAALHKEYKTGLLTNTGQGRMVELIGQDELERCFDVVVESGAIGYAKPQAQAFEIMADRLGVRLDECIMVDDRQDYCDGARGVGMQAILYVSFGRFEQDLEALLRP